jgi:uncharacterized membrane protein
MNAAHLHLALNHVPVVGIWFALLVLVLALLRASEELKRAALILFAAVGLASVPAYFSGQEAEEIVEHLPGVEHDRIEEHEESGRWAAILGGALALLAAALLWRFRAPHPLPGWAVGVPLLLALIVGAVMARTATLGGEIRHEEIR